MVELARRANDWKHKKIVPIGGVSFEKTVMDRYSVLEDSRRSKTNSFYTVQCSLTVFISLLL